jgi:hypothetical protein
MYGLCRCLFWLLELSFFCVNVHLNFGHLVVSLWVDGRAVISPRHSYQAGHEAAAGFPFICSRAPIQTCHPSPNDHNSSRTMARKHKTQTSDTTARSSFPLDPRFSLNSIRKPGGLEEVISYVSHLTWRSSPVEFERIIRDLSASPDVLALLLACEFTRHPV